MPITYTSKKELEKIEKMKKIFMFNPYYTKPVSYGLESYLDFINYLNNR